MYAIYTGETPRGSRFIVRAPNLPDFLARLRSLRIPVVTSSPVGAGYAVTVDLS